MAYQEQGNRDNKEKETATQKTIHLIRDSYCTSLKLAKGNVDANLEGYKGAENALKFNVRKLKRTRQNCNIFVNTELNVGTQLLQFDTSLGDNIKNIKQWNDAFAKGLKDIFSSIKDIKTKVNDLSDVAAKLENSKKDSCYKVQWSVLTGKPMEDCKGGDKPPVPREPCKDIDAVLHDIIHMPIALFQDIDSLFKSSSDIVGIQKFSDISKLMDLQAKLDASVKSLDASLTASIKTKKTQVDDAQTATKNSLTDRTKAVAVLYNSRCDFEEIKDTVTDICCNECGCLENCGHEEHTKPHLKNCEKKICEICGQINESCRHDQQPQEQTQKY